MIPEILTLAFGLTVTVLSLAAGHWAPWRLSRLQCYVYGTGAIWLGFAIWRLPLGDWYTPVGFAILAVGGGAATWLAYGVDGIAKRVSEAEMWREADDAQHE